MLRAQADNALAPISGKKKKCSVEHLTKIDIFRTAGCPLMGYQRPQPFHKPNQRPNTNLRSESKTVPSQTLNDPMGLQQPWKRNKIQVVTVTERAPCLGICSQGAALKVSKWSQMCRPPHMLGCSPFPTGMAPVPENKPSC